MAGLLPRVFPASKPDTFATCPPPATVARPRPRREIHTSVASATRTADSVSITGRRWPLCPTNAANTAGSSPSGNLVCRQAAARPERSKSRSIHQGKIEEGGCRPRPPPPAFHACYGLPEGGPSKELNRPPRRAKRGSAAAPAVLPPGGCPHPGDHKKRSPCPATLRMPTAMVLAALGATVHKMTAVKRAAGKGGRMGTG